MLTGVTLAENQDFRSSFDEAPEDQQTVFTIGAIDVLVRSYIQDNVTQWKSTEEGSVMLNRIALRNFELCRFGLKDIKNFKDAKGNEIKLEFVDRYLGGKAYKVASDDVLNKIPGAVLTELAEEILKINVASDTLRKK